MLRDIFTVGLLLITVIEILLEFKAVNALDINSPMGQKLNNQCMFFCQQGQGTGRVLLDAVPRQCECVYTHDSVEKYNLQDTQSLEKAAEIQKLRRPKQITQESSNADNTILADSNTNNHQRDGSESSNNINANSVPQENSPQTEKDPEVKVTEKFKDQKSCKSYCSENDFFGNAIFYDIVQICACLYEYESRYYRANGEVVPNGQINSILNPNKQNGQNFPNRESNHRDNTDMQNKRSKKGQKRRKIKQPIIRSSSDCINFCKTLQYRKAKFLVRKDICSCSFNKSNYANYDLYGNHIP